MATAALQIGDGSNLLNLLRQTVPLEEQTLSLCRRLLAINELSASMNSASDVENLRSVLASHFREYFPKDSVRLCVPDGRSYRRIRLSGPRISRSDKSVSPENSLIGEVIRSAAPLWIQDTRAPGSGMLISENSDITRVGSLMVFPFSSKRNTVGCLELLSDQPNRFDNLEYQLGLLVTAQLSSSLDSVLTRQELAAANARLRDHETRLTQLNMKLREMAHTDESTGLFNKRRLFEQLERDVARVRRYGEVLSCLMLDIDNFKQINDIHGHQAGDEILRQIGALLLRSLRVTDFVARYGGEEFTVLLPRTNSAGASCVAENLRSIFMGHPFELPSTRVHLTVSIGVSCCSTFNCLDARQVILSADDALYRAKRNGKNRTCYSDEVSLAFHESGICQAVGAGLTH